MYNRRRFLTTAGCLSVVPLASTRPVFAQGLTTITLAGTPSDDMTPLVYGINSGLFRRAGLDVQLSKMTSGAAVAAAVISGSLDLGKSSITTLFEAYDKGIPFTMVTPSVLYDAKAPYVAFLVAKDAAIASGKALENQLAGVSALGDIGTIGLRAWVDRHGGDMTKIRFVEVPLSAAAAAVGEHRVFAAESSQPALTAAVDSGKFRIFPALDAIGSSFLVAAWFTTKDTAAKRPTAMRAFAQAWAAAANYTNAHHAETVEMMSTFTGASAAVIGHMTRAVVGTTLEPALIQPLIEASVRYGGVKRSFPASELIDANVRSL